MNSPSRSAEFTTGWSRVGNEAAWWQELGIDPLVAARNYWKRTRLEQHQAKTTFRWKGA